MMWNCYVGSTSSHRTLVRSPSLEGSTPFNECRERLPERCLQRIGDGSGQRFLPDSDPASIAIRPGCLAESEGRRSKLLSALNKDSDPSLTSVPFWKERQ